MRIEQAKKTGQITNAANFKSRSFEIGDAGMIIEILRKKLYSHPIQTLVQEYISNARDANREAGAIRPIEITTPTRDNLTLAIRDFGKGLSPERVADVFVKYGNSTKRGSDQQTGGFGIGAKSAWAYTDSFTIVTYVDGTAYHYVAHVTKEHTGSLDLISETKTDQPNGTEIQISIKYPDLDDFQSAVDRASRYWENKEYPKYTNQDFAYEREHTIHRLGRFESVPGSEEILIVVDGIPYPLPDEFDDLKEIRTLGGRVTAKTLLHFITGEIEVAASREAITVNDANEKMIIAAAKKAYADVNKMLVKSMHNTKTLKEALDLHNELSESYNHEEYQFKFKNDPFTITYRGRIESPLLKDLKVMKYTESYRGERVKGSETYFDHIDFRNDKIYYSDDETSTANQLRRMKTICGSSGVYLIYGDETALKKLMGHLELPGTSTLGPAMPVRQRVRKETDRDIIVNYYISTTSKQTKSKLVNLDKNESKYIYVIRKSDMDTAEEFRAVNNLINACGLSFAIINEANAKRVKDNAKFIPYAQFVKESKKHVSKKIYKELIKSFKHQILDRAPVEHNWNLYEVLSKQTLKDRALAFCVNTLVDLNTDLNLRGVCVSNEHVQKMISFIPELKTYAEQEKAMREFHKKYPLLESITAYGTMTKVGAEMALYLNSAYRGRK